MIEKIILSILLCFGPPLIMLIMLKTATKLDVAIYNDPLKRQIVSVEIPKEPTQDQLYNIFMDQNKHELKLTIVGYFIGLCVAIGISKIWGLF